MSEAPSGVGGAARVGCGDVDELLGIQAVHCGGWRDVRTGRRPSASPQSATNSMWHEGMALILHRPGETLEGEFQDCPIMIRE